MVKLVNYADEKMIISQRKCSESSLKYGVDEYSEYNSFDIKSNSFYFINKDILDSERGAGYWLWKPYVCCKEILKLKEGDILIYADSGVQFVNSVKHIIEVMDEDIFFFTNGWPHVEWCKGDVYKTINDDLSCDKKQVQASVILFKVNQNTINFIKEWLLYCQMPGFIDDSPSKLPNYPTFAEHRHDQAILTCLQIKYGYKLHWWPTQYSEHIRVPGDNYPVIFNHHRKRNHEW